MNMQACANASARKFHHGGQEWLDRGQGDDELAPWDRRARGPDIRWDADPPDHRCEEDREGWPRPRGDAEDEPPAPNGLLAVIGGSEAAAGEASTTSGLVENVAQDRGFYSIATGEAVFEAWAYSQQPGGAFAAADAFLDILGADFIFRREFEDSAYDLNEAWARSEIDYLSIDIHGWSPRHGPIVIELDPAFDPEPYRLEASEGSLAEVLATAEAHGAGTLSATFTQALAVENQFSFVNAMALVAL